MTAQATELQANGMMSGLRAFSGFWPALLGVSAASLFLRLGGLTADVSWLLTMCERMLGGETAYVDIFETTPPVPTLLYMPAALFSHTSGLNSAAAVVATTYLAVLYTLYLTWRILPSPEEGEPLDRNVLIAAAAFGLFYLSNDVFAQREYFAAAFALPILAVLMRRRLTGEWVTAPLRWQAAILAGLTVAIKPPLFLLPGALVALYHLATTRDIRSLYSSGMIAAAGMGVLLTAVSLAAFPAYLENLTPYMRDIYVALRWPLIDGVLSLQSWTILVPLAVAAVLAYWRKNTDATDVLTVIAVGFAITFLAQGKFYWYHAFPAIFFAALRAVYLLWMHCAQMAASNARKPVKLVHYAVAALIVAETGALALHSNDDKALTMRDLTWAKSRTGYTASAISTDIALSFPLARKAGLVWADRIHGQWVAAYARKLLKQPDLSEAERTVYQQYFDNEIARTAALIAEKKPDLLFVDLRAAWLQESVLAIDPTLLTGYEVIAENEVIRILERKDRN